MGCPEGARGVHNIDSRKLTESDIKKHHNYNSIKPRLLGFYQLHDMFFGKNPVKTCLLKKDNLIKSKMNRELDILVFDDNPRESRVYVLGLKLDVKRKVYYPATFHQTKKSKYDGLKRTEIVRMIWI